MVHIHDEGSEFHAPVEKVWAYLSAAEHGPAHKDRRNSERKPVGENTLVLSSEQQIGGAWQKVSNRITLYPPVGYSVEFLEGPFAGSKSFTFYTPRGERTGVTVVGEFVSKTVPSADLEAAVLRMLGTTFDEDRVVLEAFARKR